MEKEKENAYNYFVNTIKNSWTFKKLTEQEKQNLQEVFFSVRTENAVKGSFKQRVEILNAIYFSFLKALNYEPIDWREEKELNF